MKKIGFFLMNKKGYYVLSKLIERKKRIAVIVSSRDANLKLDYYDDIRNLCLSNNINFFDRNDDYADKIDADYLITIGWRWLIKGELMKKLIVSHDSLLPKYRGFSPLVNMLINKETELGVSFLYASDKYDCGDIILQKKQAISYPIKVNKAIEIIANLFYESIDEIFDKIESGSDLIGTPQNESEATYSLWRDEDDYLIDLHQKAEDIKRLVDSVGEPFLGASLYINNQKVRILDIDVVEDVKFENRDVGKVVFMNEGKPTVVCGEGLIIINEMIDDISKESLLPSKFFRIRFKGKKL